MKFAHLSIGQRFLHRGEWLRKIDSLTAAPEAGEGGRRMIPRSAEVSVAAEDSRPVATVLSDAPLNAAFDIFRSRLQTALDAAAAKDECDLAALRAEIEAATDALQAAIGRTSAGS